MKPIMLHGHERSITQIKFNREGDLLFSCSKDNAPNVWYTVNGERLGSFNGHNGACWCIDVNWDSTMVVTGSADNTCKIWDVETGKQLHSIGTKTAVRTCGFSYSSQYFMYTTDRTMGQPCEIHIYDIYDDAKIAEGKPCITIPVAGPKVTCAVWSHLDDTIVTGHEDGTIYQWDIKTRSIAMKAEKHTKDIKDIQLSTDSSMIITASKDCQAKLFDSRSLELLKTYKTDRPVNSATISPNKLHIALGGGQEAMEVTTTSTRVGKFDARFFHLVIEEEFGRVKGHFGPINSIEFHPDGLGYASGAEDGYVRLHQFDPEYHNFDIEI